MEIAAIVIATAALVAVLVAIFQGNHRIITNDGFEAAVRETPALFDRAERKLFISTGLYPRFYEHDNVKSGLERAMRRGVNIKILVPPSKSLDGTPTIKKWAKEKLLQVRNGEQMLPHFIVVDDKHVRLETPHPSESPPRETKILLGTVKLAWKHGGIFEDHWNTAREIGRMTRR